MRRTVLLVLLVLLAVPACSSTAIKEFCSEYSCLYELSGAQSVTVEIDGIEREMWVDPVGPGSVTVSVGADEETIAEGRSARLDELSITVQEVEGDYVDLSLCRTISCGASE